MRTGSRLSGIIIVLAFAAFAAYVVQSTGQFSSDKNTHPPHEVGDLQLASELNGQEALAKIFEFSGIQFGARQGRVLVYRGAGSEAVVRYAAVAHRRTARILQDLVDSAEEIEGFSDPQPVPAGNGFIYVSRGKTETRYLYSKENRVYLVSVSSADDGSIFMRLFDSV